MAKSGGGSGSDWRSNYRYGKSTAKSRRARYEKYNPDEEREELPF